MFCVVLWDSDSLEKNISMASAKEVQKSLLSMGYKTLLLDIQNCFFLELIKNNPKPDVLFLATHGGVGENGCLQGLCEFFDIPYTHSGIMASSICMHKPTSKAVFNSVNIPTPVSCIVNSSNLTHCNVPSPHVIKSVFGGSSIDVLFSNHVKNVNNLPTGDLLIEEYIEGVELTAGILGDQYLGPLEILFSGKKIFNYDAKYNDTNTTYIKPKNIPRDILDKIYLYTNKAHNVCGCEVLSRSDFRYNPKTNKLFLLEINTHPGLTQRSLIPMMAANLGICFNDLINKIITLSFAKKYTSINVTTGD